MTSLRRRMTEDMQVRNLSSQTQATYVQQVSLFARHFNKSPEVLGPEEIRSYQVYLTNERKLAPSSIIIAVAALRFLYKITLHRAWNLEEVIPTPKKPQKLPIVLTQEEVLKFLASVRSIKHRTILTTCYAAGLRVSEAICLKVTDIDSERMVIRIQQGKGQKDRDVMLSPKLLEILRAWWRVDKPKGWLFPGDRVGSHVTRFTVNQWRVLIERTLGRTHLRSGQTEILGRGSEAAMTKENLNGAHVGTGFQQMDGKCVPPITIS
jgi:integrase/recombinase XerD